MQDRHEDARVRFEAVERVVSVDDQGRPLQSEYTVDHLELDGGRGTEVLLSAGQVLTVVRGAQEARTTVDGQAATEPVRRAIGIVLSLTAGGATDDDVFGTPDRQMVGAQWPVHADVAMRDLARKRGVQAAISGFTRMVRRTFNAAFRGMRPLDPVIPNSSSDSAMEIHVVADLQADSQSKEMEMTLASRKHVSFTPL